MNNVLKETFNEVKKKSGISHAESDIKNYTRIILLNIVGFFSGTRKTKYKIVTLGGIEFMLEKFMNQLGINFNGISYEFEPKLFPLAKQNAPQNVEVRKGNILKYKYAGDEDFIWFDFMGYVNTKNINELIRYIEKNPFRHSFTLMHVRDGNKLSPKYEKMFPKYKKEGIINHLTHHIEESGKGAVKVSESVFIPYKNIDVSGHSAQMGIYVFKIEKA